jgi:glycosyltransferase involved in cell wall biosynthesis
MRLAVITTHPIQYYAPVFNLLHRRGNIEVKVFYTWGEKSLDKYDPGFDKKINWDIPLLDGYPYEWVLNTAVEPGTHHFKGIKNPELTNQVESWQPDAVLLFGWAYHGHLMAMKYFKNKIPVFFRGDSTLLDEKDGIKTFLKTIYLRWVYRRIDHAFYVGTNNKAYFKKYGLKDNQLSFAPHAIDNLRFSADKRVAAAAVRQNLGIEDKEILILFAGKLEDKKSPLLLMEAFLSMQKPDTHLLFLGSGSLGKVLKAKAKGIKNIHFIDFENQSNIPVIYQACDLFCLPSKGPGETWGLAVNEAMACGKAILVSDKAGCAIDLVEKDINGEIFKSENINDLITSLNKLITSKDMLRTFGANSSELIKNWTFTKIAEAIENKLNEKV